MEQIEFVIESLRHLMRSLIWNGIFLVVCGLTILRYPELLTIMVSITLVAIGIINFIAAAKIAKISKFKIKI